MISKILDLLDSGVARFDPTDMSICPEIKTTIALLHMDLDLRFPESQPEDLVEIKKEGGTSHKKTMPNLFIRPVDAVDVVDIVDVADADVHTVDANVGVVDVNVDVVDAKVNLVDAKVNVVSVGNDGRISMTTQPETPDFSCDFCDERFQHVMDLDKHIKKHLEEDPNAAGETSIKREDQNLEPQRFSCPECQNTFDKRVALNQHLKKPCTKRSSSSASSTNSITNSTGNTSTNSKTNSGSFTRTSTSSTNSNNSSTNSNNSTSSTNSNNNNSKTNSGSFTRTSTSSTNSSNNSTSSTNYNNNSKGNSSSDTRTSASSTNSKTNTGNTSSTNTNRDRSSTKTSSGSSNPEANGVLDLPPATTERAEKIFFCPYCSKQGNNEHNLISHIATIHLKDKLASSYGPEQGQCGLCDKTFPTEPRLLGHLALKHKGLKDHLPSDLSLPRTTETTKSGSSDEPQTPQDRLKQNVRFGCTACESEYSSQDEVLAHRAAVHTGDQKRRLKLEAEFTCQECGANFVQEHLLLRHMADQHDVKKFPCQECGDSFEQEKLLLQHMTDQHDVMIMPTMPPTLPEQSVIDCNVCGTRFTSRQDLALHKVTLHQREDVEKYFGDQKWCCSFCGKQLGVEANLIGHLVIHHDVLTLIEAQQEEIAVSDDDNEQEPAVQQGPDGPNPAQEEEITISDDDYDDDDQEAALQQDPDGPGSTESSQVTYGCQLCEQQTMRYDSLVKHVALRHHLDKLTPNFGPGKNQCGLCNRVLTHKNSLLHHLVTVHQLLTQEIPSKESFKARKVPAGQKKALKRQTKSSLPSGQTYKCNLCDYNVRIYSKVVAHMAWFHYRQDLVKQHYGRRSRQCKICEKQFATEHSLVTHLAGYHRVLRNHIPEKEDLIQMCPPAVRETDKALPEEAEAVAPGKRRRDDHDQVSSFLIRLHQN